MAYTITKTDGTTLSTIIDGTTDSASTSLTLIGKNFPGYGVFLNQNFVKLLENFSNTTSPDDPVSGQLWWDNSNKLLKVYFETSPGNGIWKVISSSMSSSNAPPQAVVGDLWWDTANSQLKVYSGTAWVTIGPAFTATSGQTGAVADVIADDTPGQATHVVVKFFVNNQLTAILSRDAAFSPLNPATAPGFATIKPGFNLSTAIANLKYWGDADNALKLGGESSSVFARLNGTLPFTATQTVQGDLKVQYISDPVTQAVGNEFSVRTISSAVNINTGATTDFYVKVNNSPTKLLSLSSAGSGQVLVTADPVSPTGVATKQYVDAVRTYADGVFPIKANISYVDAQIQSVVTSLTGATGNLATLSSSLASYLKKDGSNEISGSIRLSANNTFTLGNATNRFSTIYATSFNGTAVQAQYADLAERFEIDTPQVPGTVVELGGAAEITKVEQELSENVFGVISTKAAYLMNASAGTDQTHPPVAVSGRVPVRVTGQVRKGDRLVSAGNGLARSAAKSEMTPWNVIGRALSSKTTEGEGVVEAIVKLNS